MVLLVSNGHGEDVIGTQLARSLSELRPGLVMGGFPIVGEGRSYEDAGLTVHGPRRALPSGGLTLHHPVLLWRDLAAGLASVTVRQLGALRRLRADTVIAVGDVYALALSSLVRTGSRFFVQTLVSARHDGRGWSNRTFMERFTALELGLIRRTCRHVYVRDDETRAHLENRGLQQVSYLGNAAMDAVACGTAPLPDSAFEPPVVALLPGSRGHAAGSLTLMLKALAAWDCGTGLVAWAGGRLPEASDWISEQVPSDRPEVVRALRRGGRKVYILRERFAEILAMSHIALGTSGTAHEQAAGFGVPVVSFPVPPLHGLRFLENQKRLLGPALTISAADAAEVASTLDNLWRDPERLGRARDAGRQLMGPPGASRRIATHVLELAAKLH